MQTETILENSETADALNSEKLMMPNMVGADFFTCRLFLENNNISIDRVYYEESDCQRNTVLFQSIKAGEEVGDRTSISLKVSGSNPINNLPSMFKNEDKNNDFFLSRYLWIFYHLYNDVNIKLDNMYKFFNPLESPSYFFKWLASWFSISVDYPVSEEVLRKLVHEAVQLYQWRGTAVGLQRFLELLTGVKPEIIEYNDQRRNNMVSDNLIIDNMVLTGDTSPFYFTVYFPVPRDHFSADEIKMINDIIKKEKPITTDFSLKFSIKIDEKVSAYSKVGLDSIG